MKKFRSIPFATAALFVAARENNSRAAAFSTAPGVVDTTHRISGSRGVAVALAADDNDDCSIDDRRNFLTSSLATLCSSTALATFASTTGPSPASARVYLDPAMYGDQELRVSAVDSLRESVRRALLQKPSLAPYFLELALLDSLSYDSNTGEGGPDGSVIKAILNAKPAKNDAHADSLRECALVLVGAKKNLRKLSSITIADAVALAGAEAVNSVGGPVLPTQLGRTDAAPDAPVPTSMPPLNLLSGGSNDLVLSTFRRAGLTEREMTALLGCLLSVDVIEKATPAGDGKSASKPQYRERGKMGRMSEFRALTDDDIADELSKDGDDKESYTIDGDDGWYIADTFGTSKTRFGKGIGGPQDFYSTMKALPNTEFAPDATQYAWIRSYLLSKDRPTAQSWVTKYSTKTLTYEKDLKVAYNAVTQLGGEYTGGKYESLLKNKKRKTLNDDELRF